MAMLLKVLIANRGEIAVRLPAGTGTNGGELRSGRVDGPEAVLVQRSTVTV